jgi:hypothetical protein
MHRIKTVILAIIAVSAIGAVASASASATCLEHRSLCVEGKQVGTPTKRVTTPFTFVQKTGTSAVITDQYAGTSVSCSVITLTGRDITSGGGVELPSPFKIGFEGCTVSTHGEAQPSCKAQVATHALTGTFTGFPTMEPVKLAPTTGTEFMEVEIHGSGCVVLWNTWRVQGTQVCSVKQAEVETATKQLVCEASGSELNLPPSFNSDVIKFSGVEGSIELAGESKAKKFSLKA